MSKMVTVAITSSVHLVCSYTCVQVHVSANSALLLKSPMCLIRMPHLLCFRVLQCWKAIAFDSICPLANHSTMAAR